MRRILAALVFCLVASTSFAADSTEFKTKDGNITIENDKVNDYIVVKTRNNVIYRIYPCGKLEKQVYRELNPNEDDNTITTISGGSYYIRRSGDFIAY